MTSPIYHHRARLAVLTRHHGAGAPEVTDAERDLRVARAEKILRDVVESAPPLNPADVERLRALLPAPITTEGGADAA